MGGGGGGGWNGCGGRMGGEGIGWVVVLGGRCNVFKSPSQIPPGTFPNSAEEFENVFRFPGGAGVFKFLPP